jgi:hypothetical protein
MREKHGVGKKVLVIDVDEGILLKPAPPPSREKGSLKRLLGTKSAREILAESRSEDRRRERKLLEHGLELLKKLAHEHLETLKLLAKNGNYNTD